MFLSLLTDFRPKANPSILLLFSIIMLLFSKYNFILSIEFLLMQ